MDFSTAPGTGSAFLALLGAVVMVGAQALPIGLIPEQHLVTAVWGLVVDRCGWFHTACGLAHHAQGVSLQIRFAGFLPGVDVATLVGCRARLLLTGLVLHTPTTLHERRAAGVGARSRGCVGHREIGGVGLEPKKQKHGFCPCFSAIRAGLRDTYTSVAFYLTIYAWASSISCSFLSIAECAIFRLLEYHAWDKCGSYR